MTGQDKEETINRRRILKAMAASIGCALAPGGVAFARDSWHPAEGDQAFLDDLVRQGCLYFWEQGHPGTGQVLDRASNRLNGALDPRWTASIAATGFGLTALCIADHRRYLPHAEIVERVRITLDWHLNHLPEVHGFFYHFTDVATGKRQPGSEISSIDTSLLLCGILMAREYFKDAQIRRLATEVYERVDWPWLLNGGKTFSMGWQPESGFLKSRWNHYCESLMIYLLAIGSPTHAVPPGAWDIILRPVVHYAGFDYISGVDSLFTHQYSQAWFDFRNKSDAYADYFANSVKATRAHKAFCLSYPKWYNEQYWGITASDSANGYAVWGGPPVEGQLDGTVVPCAAAGSLPFLPAECIAVLRAMRAKWGKRVWGRYGFVDAFHPAANWYDADVIGIDQGISVLMAENLRSGLVWKTFMHNREAVRAMKQTGFHGQKFAWFL
jgi:hypothetical protein